MRFRGRIAHCSDRCVAKWIPDGGRTVVGSLHAAVETRDILSFCVNVSTTTLGAVMSFLWSSDRSGEEGMNCIAARLDYGVEYSYSEKVHHSFCASEEGGGILTSCFPLPEFTLPRLVIDFTSLTWLIFTFLTHS